MTDQSWANRSVLSTKLMVRALVIWTLLIGLVFQTAIDPAVRAAPPSDGTLFRKLVGRNRSVRSQAITTLESDRNLTVDSMSALVSAAEEIARDARDRDSVDLDLVRLVQLIGSIDGDLAEQGLVALLDSPNTGIAMIAAATLGKHKFYGAIDYLKKQADHPAYKESYAFRFNLIRALVQMEHPDAIEFITALGKSLDGQLRHKVDQALQAVTLADFRDDKIRFNEWLATRSTKPPASSPETRESESIFQNVSHEPESLKRIRLAQQQYYGIEIHAKRLMFIIDHSGSMKEYDGGQTRLDRAKVELVRVIESLPSDTEFALVFYDTRIAKWRNQLVMATDKNKQDAIKLIRSLKPGDSTNTHGALRTALDFDESLEAVFLLTDGRPTAGEIIHPNLIVEDILHRNRFRHLNFNTIGIALSQPTEQFLRTLSEESGGEFRSAN